MHRGSVVGSGKGYGRSGKGYEYTTHMLEKESADRLVVVQNLSVPCRTRSIGGPVRHIPWASAVTDRCLRANVYLGADTPILFFPGQVVRRIVEHILPTRIHLLDEGCMTKVVVTEFHAQGLSLPAHAAQGSLESGPRDGNQEFGRYQLGHLDLKVWILRIGHTEPAQNKGRLVEFPVLVIRAGEDDLIFSEAGHSDNHLRIRVKSRNAAQPLSEIFHLVHAVEIIEALIVKRLDVFPAKDVNYLCFISTPLPVSFLSGNYGVGE